MLHNFKKQLGIAAALLGIGVAGIAYAASTASEATMPRRVADNADGTAATVTWAMDCPLADIAGVSTSEKLTFSHAWGSKVTQKSAGYTYGGLTFSHFQVAGPPDVTDSESSVSFTITPEGTFDVSNISFEGLTQGWGDGRFTLEVSCGGTSKVLLDKITPVRDNVDITENSPLLSADVSGVAATSDSPVTVTIYFQAKDDKNLEKNRSYAVRNLVVTGTLYEGEAPEPVDNTFKMPGVVPVPSSNASDDHYDFSGNLGVQGSDGVYNFCDAYDGRYVIFKNIEALEAGAYKAVMPVDYSYGEHYVLIEVTDASTGMLEAVYNGLFPKNNSSYEVKEFPLEGVVTEGLKNVKIAFTVLPDKSKNFAGNFREVTFVRTGDGEPLDPEVTVPSGWLAIPGALTISGNGDGWVYNGGIKWENETKGVGYVKNGNTASKDFYCKNEGVYEMSWDIYSVSTSGSSATVTVTDQETGNIEATGKTVVTSTGNQAFTLDGVITVGKKTLTLTFATTGSYAFNYLTPTFTKVADSFAAIRTVSVEGAEAVQAEGFDWAFNLPDSYTAAETTIKVDAVGGTVAAAMENGEVTDNGDGTFTVATPAGNTECVVNLTLTPAEGALSSQTEYSVRLFHIGGVLVSGVTVDGVAVSEELVAALNDGDAATLDGEVFTTVPVVEAKFADNTTAVATAVMEGTTARYSFVGASGNDSKEFAFAVEGVYLYSASESDKSADMMPSTGSKDAEGTWSNGALTLAPSPDQYNDYFKLRFGTVYTIGMPVTYKVKQVIFHKISNNYSGNAPARMAEVASDGATVYLPTTYTFVHSSEATPGDLIVNIENHTPGTPITFKGEGDGQLNLRPELVYEEVAPADAPVLVGQSITSTEHTNHAVVSLTFDRVMESGEALLNGNTLKAEGGSTVLRFSVWNLPYGETSTLNIAPGDATDIYGNSNDEPISIDIVVGEQAVETLGDFIYVTTVDEFKAALASVKATNSSASSAAVTVYIANGIYDFGSELQDVAGNNITFVGESREGVVLCGQKNGISDPVLQTRNAFNVHFENLTIQNNQSEGDDRRVAFYGGKRDVFVNCNILGFHDTVVTGEKGYYLNCRIEGGVDFICGGGDHLFDHCELITNKEGAVIAAPSTTSSTRHGYVFMNCTIDGVAGYHLGRPWQNEPRVFFLNTTMKALSAAEGWRPMGEMTTHFYEYNSMDANGAPIDLSSRTCPSGSVNNYVPVLPEEYVPYFTIENVLGGTESWLANEGTETLEAPTGFYVSKASNSLTWSPVANASGYILYVDGEYEGFTAVPEYRFGGAARVASRISAITDDNVFTVRALNAKGVPGEMSINVTTGVENVAADGGAVSERFFDVNGVEVGAGYRGICIRVATAADGTVTTTKVVR